MIHRLLLLLLLLLLAPYAQAGAVMEMQDGTAASTFSPPGGAASVVTASCAVADCTATCNCPANTIVVFAASRNSSATCTGSIDNTTDEVFHRFNCVGATSCAQLEASLNNAACCRIACAGN